MRLKEVEGDDEWEYRQAPGYLNLVTKHEVISRNVSIFIFSSQRNLHHEQWSLKYLRKNSWKKKTKRDKSLFHILQWFSKNR